MEAVGPGRATGRPSMLLAQGFFICFLPPFVVLSDILLRILLR